MLTAESGRRQGVAAAFPSALTALATAVRRRMTLRDRAPAPLGSGVGALEFIAHELRTPLAVIRGYLSMIEDGTYPVPPKTRDEVVTIIAAKARELDSLIDVLLMSSRLAGGRLPVQASHFDVAEAVQAAVAEVAPRASLEWATIDAWLPDSGPVEVTADRSHVVRILVNLLNNSLTYSPRPATVTIAVRRQQHAEVIVRDRGIGLAADRQRAIFERFTRVGDRRSWFTAGLGLGLPMSRELAMLNRGSLTLDHSEPGGGSIFVLRLPVRGR
jgi:signal transduction histidine kinase